MKYYTLFALCVFAFNTCWSQNYKEKETEEIKQFLVDFSKAAIAKDTTLLKSYIFSSQTNPSQDYQGTTIKYILKNDENAQRDFAYSHKALQVVIEEEINQFKPIPEQIYTMLIGQPDGIFLEATKDLSSEEIPIFDYKNAHIILVRRDQKYQLVFWENLNNLLQP